MLVEVALLQKIVTKPITSALKTNNQLLTPYSPWHKEWKATKKTILRFFIRSYTLEDGSPKVIAFIVKQLEDLANFCCLDKNQFKSMLFIDITFQLRPFYLLLTVYQNSTRFVKSTEGCPTMMGPLMLCMLKDECTYLTLFQKM